MQIGSGFESEFAWGQAASGLQGKVTRKAKIKIGGQAIHREVVVTAPGETVNSGAGLVIGQFG